MESQRIRYRPSAHKESLQLLFLRHFLFIWLVFQDISGLAVQFFADGLKGSEADGFGLSCLEDGEVGGSDADFVS